MNEALKKKDSQTTCTVECTNNTTIKNTMLSAFNQEINYALLYNWIKKYTIIRKDLS
jgi:hypothetical protein